METNIPDSVINEVDEILTKKYEGQTELGLCHRIWSEKKEMLKARGYDWKTPSEQNPMIMYD